MTYTLTTQLQIFGLDSANPTLPVPIHYTASLMSTQSVASPARQRYTVTTAGQTVTLVGQGIPPIAASSGSVPRVRFINTSGAGSVSLVSAALVTSPVTPTLGALSLLLGPGAIIDLAFYQIYNQSIAIQPAEITWVGVVPASAATPVVVDVLFL